MREGALKVAQQYLAANNFRDDYWRLFRFEAAGLREADGS
jgi:hypothetical protein